MIIPFDGYRIVLFAETEGDCLPKWKAVVMDGLIPCAIATSDNPLDAISSATVMYHESYLMGREAVRKFYYLVNEKERESSQGPSSN